MGPKKRKISVKSQGGKKQRVNLHKDKKNRLTKTGMEMGDRIVRVGVQVP